MHLMPFFFILSDSYAKSHLAVSQSAHIITVEPPIIILQVTDGCETFQLGDKFAIFSLSVDDLTEGGGALGAYGVTFTNTAGSVSVPETRVTGRGTVLHHHDIIHC